MSDKVNSLIDEDELVIENDIVYRFEFESEEFIIEYSMNNEEWSAVHLDEEIWDERVIIENKEIEFSDDILLFNEYNLTIEELNEMKELVTKDMEESGTNNI